MKRIVRWLLIAVLALWVLRDPSGAAALARDVMAAAGHAARSLSALAAGLHS
jgi:hypothetical protein